MSEESETTRFLALSPSDNTAKDPNKRSKISYAREFLLSVAKLELIVLPRDVHLSISRGSEDLSGILSPAFCDSNSRLDKSMLQQSSMNVLHKSIEPYWPPHRYKALCESSGSSDPRSQKKAETERCNNVLHEEKSYADKVRLSKEDKWHINEDTDCDESSEALLMSPASGNFSKLQSSSNATAEELDDRHKPSLIQGAVKCNALQLTIVPGTTTCCSTERQILQDVFINNPVNLWQKSVNDIDSYQHLPSLFEEIMHLKESKACSNLSVGHPDRVPDVMESQKKIRSPNLKKKLFEFYEKCAKCKDLEDYVSSVEDKKIFLSMADKCELAMVHCEGNMSLHDVNQAISIKVKQNSSSSDFQMQQDLDLNAFSKPEETSNCSPELFLPDEDSLIRFDEPFLMHDEQNWGVVDESMSSPEKNPINAGMSCPSSPGDMVEKLVEAILNDESSPAPLLVDPKVNPKSGLHAQQSHTQFCHYQLSPERDQQVNNSFQSKSIDTTPYSSLVHHPFPLNNISQPFHLCHDERTRFNHVSLPMFQQMPNADKPCPCSFCGSLRGLTPDLSKRHMVSSTQKLNSMQGFTLGYQEPIYGGYTWPKPGSHTDGHNDQAAADDSLFDMKLRSWPWHPFEGGF